MEQMAPRIYAQKVAPTRQKNIATIRSAVVEGLACITGKCAWGGLY